MPVDVQTETRIGRASPKPGSEVPGPRLPRPLQSWLGVIRPIGSRLALRERYGPVFRTNDALLGEVFHICDRELVEQMFKWKPGDYNVGEPRQVMEPVTGPSSILLLDEERHLLRLKAIVPENVEQLLESLWSLRNEYPPDLPCWSCGAPLPLRETKFDPEIFDLFIERKDVLFRLLHP